MAKKHYVIHTIQWDTDQEDASALPRAMIVSAPASLAGDELEEALSEMLSEQTGFCHGGFRYDPVSPDVIRITP